MPQRCQAIQRPDVFDSTSTDIQLCKSSSKLQPSQIDNAQVAGIQFSKLHEGVSRNWLFRLLPARIHFQHDGFTQRSIWHVHAVVEWGWRLVEPHIEALGDQLWNMMLKRLRA